MSDIAIIIPAFNAGKTLKRCVESIQGQTTATDITICIVNDGSSDNTEEIIAELKNNNAPITSVTQSNHGAAHARNIGAQKTNSTYIIFCDADIVLDPDALKKMHQALEDNPQAAYAYGSFYLGNKLFKGREFSAEELKKAPYIHTTALMRRKTFPGFDTQLKRFQDWDLWLTMLQLGHRGVFVDQVLFKIIADGTISQWFPSFFLKIWPLTLLSRVKRYKKAEKIIKKKHKL